MKQPQDWLLSVLSPFADGPHLLIPRRGISILRALQALGVSSMVEWDYYESPAEEFARPAQSIPVDSALPELLKQNWKDEVYGASFPERLYVPKETSEYSYRRLSSASRMLANTMSINPRAIKLARKTLRQLEWSIAVLDLAPFNDECVTNYCLMLLQDETREDLVNIAMLESDQPCFRLDPTSTRWPVPNEFERGVPDDDFAGAD